jgi:hypothetical protein
VPRLVLPEAGNLHRRQSRVLARAQLPLHRAPDSRQLVEEKTCGAIVPAPAERKRTEVEALGALDVRLALHSIRCVGIHERDLEVLWTGADEQELIAFGNGLFNDRAGDLREEVAIECALQRPALRDAG